MKSPNSALRLVSHRLGLLAIASAVATAVGIAFAPERIWSNLLLLGFYSVAMALGGALFMNAGAYGHEISDHLISVTVLSADGHIREIPRTDCGYAYRQAAALRGTVILAGTWDLPRADREQTLATRRGILARRREKQPLEFPSAGSVFKRPEGAYASALIAQAGLKGTRIGGAQVSEKHAGFIVNVGDATCQDVLDLVALCRATVRERFGHDLELEQQLCPACPCTEGTDKS